MAQVAPARHEAPPKTRTEVLVAVTSKAFPLRDNEFDALRNRSQPLCGSIGRCLTTLFILPLAFSRILLFVVVFVATGCTAALAACLPARSCGRNSLLSIAMRGIRCGLFVLGYHHVQQVGAPSEDARIVCCNHVSFVETFYLTSLLTPCGMSEVEAAGIPMLGSVLRALEWVLVDKGSAASRAEAGREMAAKLCDKNAPRFLVFAEGQTSDGRQVLAFKDGAFRLGHAVQPVRVRVESNRAARDNVDVRAGGRALRAVDVRPDERARQHGLALRPGRLRLAPRPRRPLPRADVEAAQRNAERLRGPRPSPDRGCAGRAADQPFARRPAPPAARAAVL